MTDLGELYEIIFVNDGSADESPHLLRDLQAKDGHVKLLSLSRNFGHQLAITAGLDYSRGQAVIVMDADLQDPPEVIPRLIDAWRTGYDIVFAVRQQRRGDGLFKRVTAALFYRILRCMTATEIPLDTGDFRLMSRKAVDTLKGIRERNRFLRGLSGWMGFRQTSVPFVRDVRHAGENEIPFQEDAAVRPHGYRFFLVCAVKTRRLSGFFGILHQFFLHRICHWLEALYRSRRPGLDLRNGGCALHRRRATPQSGNHRGLYWPDL